MAARLAAAAAACPTWVLTLFATVVQATVPSSGKPDRAADLLGGVEQAGGDTGVLVGHVVQGDQGQRDEHQPEPERADELRAEQLAGVAGVLGQPGEPEHPARDLAQPATISGRGPSRGISCEASPEAITTPTANGR